MPVRTNNKPRPLFSFRSIPAWKKKDFDYTMDRRRLNFFLYKGEVYDVEDFLLSATIPAPWSGAFHQTFDSGLYIRHLSSDSVLIGRFWS
jgi:hypothetical protein